AARSRGKSLLYCGLNRSKEYSVCVSWDVPNAKGRHDADLGQHGLINAPAKERRRSRRWRRKGIWSRGIFVIRKVLAAWKSNLLRSSKLLSDFFAGGADPRNQRLGEPIAQIRKILQLCALGGSTGKSDWSN